jgi:predicted GNAT family acetyltransferase
MGDVRNNESERRFEITVDGHTAFLKYAMEGGRLNLVHTEVPPELGGKGLGGTLAHAALEYARASQLSVVPSCPFVKRYLEKHPEYAALVS